MKEIYSGMEQKWPITCMVFCASFCILDGVVTVLDFPALIIGADDL